MKITSEMFRKLDNKEKAMTNIALLPVRSLARESWQRFCSNKRALVALVIILLIVCSAILCPLLSPYNTHQMNLSSVNCRPFADHYFGTDGAGRDLWIRVWSGTRISLSIAVIAATLNLVIGVLYGGISGYFGGKIDIVMQRIIEVVQGIPPLIILILLMLIIHPGIMSIALAIAMTSWINMSLVVRGQILKLKSAEYILSAKTLGAGYWHILRKHLIPNMRGPIIVTLTLRIPIAIFFEVFLSFIGLGMPVDQASLGTLLMSARRYLDIYPYQVWYPIAIIVPLILACNMLGDGLRDALDSSCLSK